MQIYKRMDIGTAKPTAEEMRGITHHMLDVAEPWEDYSVSRYAQEAALCVEDILSRGRLPIIVGGTGLYIDALINGTDFAPQGGGTALRDSLSREYDEKGGAEMLRRLAEIDSSAAVRLHENDKKRIVRALEVWYSTGKTITEHDAETRLSPPRYEAARLALTFSDREALYSRINLRVDRMREKGLLEETRSLISSGVPEKCTAMQAIGYKELLPVLRGECSEDEAFELIKQSSRRYAKRQLSWFGRYPEICWIRHSQAPDFGEALRISTEFLRSKDIIKASE